MSCTVLFNDLTKIVLPIWRYAQKQFFEVFLWQFTMIVQNSIVDNLVLVTLLSKVDINDSASSKNDIVLGKIDQLMSWSKSILMGIYGA